jgi:hypothetical protein
MSSLMRSFKIGASTGIVGVLTADESTAVRGKIGPQTRLIPLRIRVRRYNDPNSQGRQFNCGIVNNRLLTPLLLRASISSIVQLRGALPPDNTVNYKGVIEFEGERPIEFENVSTGQELAEVIRDGVSPVALMMNNPYRQVKIKSFDFDVQVSEKNVAGAIWSAQLSQSKVKPGGRLDVEVVI